MSGSDSTRSYVVECYWPEVSEEKLAEAARRADQAATELRRRGADVNFVGSILVPVDETVFCLFDGVEADILAASEQAGIPFERVLASLWVDGGQYKGRRNRGHSQTRT